MSRVMWASHVVESTFGHLPITVCLSINPITHSSGIIHVSPVKLLWKTTFRLTLEFGYPFCMWTFMGTRIRISCVICSVSGKGSVTCEQNGALIECPLIKCQQSVRRARSVDLEV